MQKKMLDACLGPEVRDCYIAVRSWVHFRFIAATILDLDVVAFLALVIREFLLKLKLGGQTDTVADSFEQYIPDAIAYPVGTLLIVTSLYSKVSAHKTLGHYAWFWGDFFFRVSGSLVFDGVFELFPHPMYSYGYAWMYGFAIIVRSYGLFALVIGCHLCQMAFLSIVENPHIDKIYGKDKLPTGTRERTSNFFAITNFDVFRASDVGSVLMALFFVIACIFGVHWNPLSHTCGGSSPINAPCLQYNDILNDTTLVADDDKLILQIGISRLVSGAANVCYSRGHHDYWCNTTDGNWGYCNCGFLGSTFFATNAIFWRVFHTLVCGLVLHWQNKNQFWTRHFERKGLTKVEAFQHWIQIQNLTSTMAYASFFAAACYFFQWSHPLFSSYSASQHFCFSRMRPFSVTSFAQLYVCFLRILTLWYVCCALGCIIL